MIYYCNQSDELAVVEYDSAMGWYCIDWGDEFCEPVDCISLETHLEFIGEL